MSMTWQLRRRLRNQWPFLTVLAIVTAAFVYLTIWPDHWRRGTAVMAVAMLIAAVLRALLPGPHAGLLAVRGRWRDTVVYLALGVFILIVDIRLH
jgi:hypothetical protein